MNQQELRILSQAQAEIERAFEWYYCRSSAVAEAFLVEVGSALEKISAHPQLYSPYLKKARRYILETFPYSVIFRQIDNKILVIAVAHAKRCPDYWIKRA